MNQRVIAARALIMASTSTLYQYVGNTVLALRFDLYWNNVLMLRVRPYISDLPGTTLRGKSSVSWIRGYLSFWNWIKFNRRSRRLKFTTIWDQMVSARELRPCNSGYCLQDAVQSYWPRMRCAREFILPGNCHITWFSKEDSLIVQFRYTMQRLFLNYPHRIQN
jgi:hypothetical protein